VGGEVKPHLDVERLSSVNLFAEDYNAAVAVQRDVLGAQVFREQEEPVNGGRNALGLVGRTCVEVFAPTSSDGAIGRWLAGHGTGWHSVEWTIPSLDGAVRALDEQGIRVAEGGGDHILTQPRDLHGLCLELTARHLSSDDRDVPGWQPPRHPLGITEPVTVKIASTVPADAAAQVADLVGRPSTAVDRPHLNAVGHRVEFADHVIEFVGSASGSMTDLVGRFLERHGERIFCVSFGVADLAQARAFLVRLDVPFTQWGRHSLLLGLELTRGARIELTDV
jgi:catechol 2,3-dioxygenase-like lactoylglutathione lyase family enzyme